MNAFEAGERKVIPAVLVYARCQGQTLMLCRDGGASDYHQGKWNGLGGKLNPDETPQSAAQREFAEEAGLELPMERFRPMGCLQFPLFKADKNEDWLVFLFTLNFPLEKRGDLLSRCPEGSLHWVADEKLLGLNLWPGDRHFLPLVLAGKALLGTFYYQGQELTRHELITF